MAMSDTRKRFNQAFREARASGDKTFMFEGKKYTTDLAPAAPKKPEYVSDKEPVMGEYKPRREPKPLTEVTRPGTNTNYENTDVSDMSMKKGGKVSSASKRADGIAQKGKTRGRMV
jgi:hypothetical protein